MKTSDLYFCITSLSNNFGMIWFSRGNLVNEKPYQYTFARPMTSKHGSVVILGLGTSPTKSHDVSTMSLHE